MATLVAPPLSFINALVAEIVLKKEFIGAP
jgi:hypothetical protein